MIIGYLNIKGSCACFQDIHVYMYKQIKIWWEMIFSRFFIQWLYIWKLRKYNKDFINFSNMAYKTICITIGLWISDKNSKSKRLSEMTTMVHFSMVQSTNNLHWDIAHWKYSYLNVHNVYWQWSFTFVLCCYRLIVVYICITINTNR